MHLKYGQRGHMANKKKNLCTNNPKFQGKILKATYTEAKYPSKNQESLHQRKLDTGYKSINQTSFKKLYITLKIRDNF